MKNLRSILLFQREIQIFMTLGAMGYPKILKIFFWGFTLNFEKNGEPAAAKRLRLHPFRALAAASAASRIQA